MAACQVMWCVCLPQPEAVCCVVHQRHAALRPMPARDDTRLSFFDCDECDGTGECDVCGGTGAHECSDWRCNETHDCGFCHGDGKCPTCRLATKQPENEYLRAVYDGGLKPLPPPYCRPWDEASEWNRELLRKRA